ncbi:hypothetical protein E2C01_012644 [Portunus trituberculatus]|uniref:Uncharacterized protein n=1 Tax=Portunus trituberculatus TaxID=210409 RepID=A0A5B7DEK2_PORTR|nr:hypothetical protein [Portunus trituberculatus]
MTETNRDRETERETENNSEIKQVLSIDRSRSLRNVLINPLSTMTHFHIHSAYYLVIVYSFRNLYGD